MYADKMHLTVKLLVVVSGNSLRQEAILSTCLERHAVTSKYTTASSPEGAPIRNLKDMDT